MKIILTTYKFSKGPLIKYVLSNKPTFLLLLFGRKLEWKRFYSQFELLVLQLGRVLFMIIFPHNQSIKRWELIPLDNCLCVFFVIVAILTFFVKHEGGVMFINAVLITLITKRFGAMLFAQQGFPFRSIRYRLLFIIFR